MMRAVVWDVKEMEGNIQGAGKQMVGKYLRGQEEAVGLRKEF